jgi:opacity protein-like surface antigen
LSRDPLTFSLEGGYTIAAGSSRQLLEDGSNVGFGLTWFPIPSLPVGLRVDGSYSSFHAKDAFINMVGGPGYTSGRERVYGGDADLQLDLAHQSSRSKLYLFGGAGWYREQTHLRQVSLVDGAYCDFFGYCWPGLVPVITASSRTTSNWRSSWNAGLGWEVALSDHASFFVEARYQWIAPHSDQLQFVPIRVGLRF